MSEFDIGPEEEDSDATKLEDWIPAPGLFNAEAQKMQHVLKREEPHHRAICLLLAQGLTPGEVADQTGFTPCMVRNLKKQPWAQKYILETMERAGRKVVLNELHGAALEAAKTLIGVMKGDVEGSKASDRSKAANDILNRCYGTAVQTVQHGKVDPKDLSDEELVTIISHSNRN